MCFFCGGGICTRERIEFSMDHNCFLQCVGKWAVVNNYKIKSKRNKKILKFFKLSSLPRHNLTFLKAAEE
jgi:hypothetical protein